MGVQVVRFEKDKKVNWGVVSEGSIFVLDESYITLADFLENGAEKAKGIKEQENVEIIGLHEVTILSPITKPARIVCQGANYSSHREEAGLEAERPPFNMIFGKADSSLTGAYSDIVRPPHVKLLDYEIELGLVIGTEITEPQQVTDKNLHQYIAGIVIADDVSARDVQFSQGQWLKGKSYRTFCPTGPYLYLLDKEDIPKIHDLELNLWVNEELRQSSNTSLLLFKPAETLTELSEIMDLSKGDLILTGTTGGVALNLSPEVVGKVSGLDVSPQKKLEIILETQLASDKYLQDGDVVRLSIKSADGSIDLGEQISKVVSSK